MTQRECVIRFQIKLSCRDTADYHPDEKLQIETPKYQHVTKGTTGDPEIVHCSPWESKQIGSQ